MKILIFVLLLAATSLHASVSISGSAASFMLAETQNSFHPSTTVAEEFQPQYGKTFRIKFLEIPIQDVHVVDSAGADPKVRKHFFIKKNGQKWIRFFVHPESEELYAKLIERYGVAGEYVAAATASTRTVLAWPENDPEDLIFLKLSLAKRQSDLGRIVPGWEVRRSVGVSATALETPKEVWQEHGASIISDFAGAYVDASEGLSFYVDTNQQNVSEHGLIARDASFLNDFPNDLMVPLFSLFHDPGNGKKPKIFELWEKRHIENGISFSDFISLYLFKPFLDLNSYMLFRQGIVGEFHAQNVVVVLDRKTGAIKHFYHRDTGSMKVDLLLRWSHGLGVKALRSQTPLEDFKFERARTAFEDHLNDYLYGWVFVNAYQDVILKYAPDTKLETIRKNLLRMALDKVREELPLRNSAPQNSIYNHVMAYYSENPPKRIRTLSSSQFSERKIRNFISRREREEQTMVLPEAWRFKFSKLPALTEYGIVYLDQANVLKMALHASANLDEIRFKKATCRQVLAQ